MPIKTGSSEKTKQQNIRELIKAGHPEKQAVAISENEARRHAADEVWTKARTRK